MVTQALRYENGTIRIDAGDDPGGPDVDALPGVEWDPRSKTGRAPAFRYAKLRETLADRDIDVDDRVLDLPDLDLASAYELRDYQHEALAAWADADRRGTLELPTGSGKTVIGLKAMERLGTPALVVVPTIDLLLQWREELRSEFGVPVGQLGGGTQEIEALTIATYDSAMIRAEDLGDRFGLAVFDEIHHLGGERYREIARLLAAPARMGLTATFERPDGAHEVVVELVGPVVYRLDPEDLAGEHLAPYDVKRIEVDLTPEERREYADCQETFTNYLARSSIDMRSGQDYRKLVMRSGNDPAAREALLAKQRAREIVFNADAKLEALADILDRHREDRIIVFTAHNDLVYRIAERFLIPAITHQTGSEERRRLLENFREGTYSRIVTSNVLDEGVDVPDANVAVVLSGSGSEREFVQRLGRVLRPKDDGVRESASPDAGASTTSSLGERALMYEVVSRDTAEENVAQRRR
ncbi:MAG: DEAD/DEAH box helicase family protein [Halobacteriales archaeon]